MGLHPLGAAVTDGWNQTASGTYNFNDANNWVNGTANGNFSSGLTLTGNQTLTTATALSLNGLQINYTGNYTWTLRANGGAQTLTLNGDVVMNAASFVKATIGSTTANQNLNIDLGGTNRSFTVYGTGYSSDTLALLNQVSNGGITKNGAGILQLAGVDTYTGATIVNYGSVLVTGSVLNTSEFRIASRNNGGAFSYSGEELAKLAIDNSTAGANASRISTSAKITLNNGNFSMNNYSGGSNIQTVGTLTLESGSNQLTVTRNGAANTAGIEMASLVRQNNAVLRLTADATLGAGGASSSIKVTDSASVIAQLVGGGGAAGTTTISILPWAVGATTSKFDRSAYGFVTYDATNGFRTLTVSEYIQSLAASTSVNDNIYLSASEALSSDRTINSLVFTNTGSSPVARIVSGATATLTISSGALYASANTAGSGGTNGISVGTLNFGGREAVIGVSGYSSAASVFGISSNITNTGNKGLTKYGAGELQLSGANTYTGDTVVAEGVLSSQINSAIPDASVVRVQSAGKYYVAAGKKEQIGGLAGSGVVYLGSTASQLNVGGSSGTNGAITINSGGHLAPGDLAGGYQVDFLTLGQTANATNLIFQEGSFLDIELASLASYDSVVVANGTAMLDGNLTISLLNGYKPNIGDTFTLLTASGGITGSFDSITSGYEVDIVGNTLQVTVIPEPSTWAMVLGGGMMLLWLGSRKRRLSM